MHEHLILIVTPLTHFFANLKFYFFGTGESVSQHAAAEEQVENQVGDFQVVVKIAVNIFQYFHIHPR